MRGRDAGTVAGAGAEGGGIAVAVVVVVVCGSPAMFANVCGGMTAAEVEAW